MERIMKKYSLKKLLNENEMEQMEVPFEDSPVGEEGGQIDREEARALVTAALEGGSPPSEDSNLDPCLDLAGNPSDMQADNLPQEGATE